MSQLPCFQSFCLFTFVCFSVVSGRWHDLSLSGQPGVQPAGLQPSRQQVTHFSKLWKTSRLVKARRRLLLSKSVVGSSQSFRLRRHTAPTPSSLTRCTETRPKAWINEGCLQLHQGPFSNWRKIANTHLILVSSAAVDIWLMSAGCTHLPGFSFFFFSFPLWFTHTATSLSVERHSWMSRCKSD